MKTTIDKAGRIVIPAAIRQRAHLEPGTPLEISVEDFTVRIVRAAPPPKLARRGTRLVARPTAKASELPRVNIAEMIEQERDRWP